VTSPALSVQDEAARSRRTHSQVGSERQGVGTNMQAAWPTTDGATTAGAGANLGPAMEGRAYSQNSTPVAHSDGPHANRCGGSVGLEQAATETTIAPARARIPKSTVGQPVGGFRTTTTSSFDKSLLAPDPDQRGPQGSPDGPVRHRTVEEQEGPHRESSS
jgi:hypothetical protein